MAVLDQTQTVHGRRAARTTPRLSPLFWPVAAMVVMTPLLIALVVSMLS